MKRLFLILMTTVLIVIMIGCTETTTNSITYADGDAYSDGDDNMDVIDAEEITGDEESISDVEGENDSGDTLDDDTDLDDISEFEEVGEIERPEPQCDVTGTGKQISVQPSSETIDFGTVKIGEYKTAFITVCNSGTDTFSVTGMWIRSGDSPEFQVQSDQPPVYLASGEGTMIAVVYQPLDYSDDSGTLEILSDSDRSRVDISLIGKAQALGQLQVTPQVLQFQNQVGSKIVTLDNVGIVVVSVTSLRLVDDSHFSFIAVDPGGMTGPWNIEPDAFMRVSVSFDGDASAEDTELIIVWFDGESQIESTVALQVGAGACAIPNAGPDQVVAPMATVQLDGSLSVDPNDAPAPDELWYQWNFAKKPQGAFRATIVDASGASIQGVWSTEARPTFYAELNGLYVVQLRINRQDDPGCNPIDTVNIMAATEEAVHIELSWSTPNNDHDLHLIRYNVEGQTDGPGCFTYSDADNANDCHWTNCNTLNKTATPCPPRGCPGPEKAPDWGFIDDRYDDPTLDVDDIQGTGPEELNLYRPAFGDYFVSVERFSGSDTPELTLKIWIYGVLSSTFDNVAIPEVHDHWNVCWLKVHSATDIEVVPIGIIKESGDNITRDCDPTNPQVIDGDIDDDIADTFEEIEVDLVEDADDADISEIDDVDLDPVDDSDSADLPEADSNAEEGVIDGDTTDDDFDITSDQEPDDEIFDVDSDLDFMDAEREIEPEQSDDDSDSIDNDSPEIEEIILDCTPGSVCCNSEGFYQDYGIECDDGDPCTAGDFCDGSGSCLSQPADCPGGCEFGMCMHNHAIQLTGLDTRNLYVAGSESLQIHVPNMTLEMWVKGVPGSGVIEKGKFSLHNCNYAMGFYCDVNVCSVGFGFDSDGIQYWWKAALTTGTSTNGWNHIAAVADNLNEEVRLYHNGVLLTDWLAQPATWPVGIILPEYRQLQIGSSGDPVRVDEIRLSDIPRYGVSFTPTYHFEPDANTRLLLHMNEGAGTVAHDSSEYGNHASFDLEPTPPTWVEDSPGIVFACANGICTDPNTGLEWQQTATGGGVMTWDEAVSHCDSLELDGGGWRLPSISELRTLVRGCDSISTWGECPVANICDYCGIDEQCLSSSCYSAEYCDPASCPDNVGCYWPDEILGLCGRYVSSSLMQGSTTYAWTILFNYGRVSSVNVTYTDSRALCVRNGL